MFRPKHGNLTAMLRHREQVCVTLQSAVEHLGGITRGLVTRNINISARILEVRF